MVRAALSIVARGLRRDPHSSFTTVGRWEREHSILGEVHFVHLARLLHTLKR